MRGEGRGLGGEGACVQQQCSNNEHEVGRLHGHCALRTPPRAHTPTPAVAQVANSSPPFHALIDTGALITGMSNLSVAKHLLAVGLHDFDAVIFLDELDRKMTLLRKSSM